jgi:hypothetical protein
LQQGARRTPGPSRCKHRRIFLSPCRCSRLRNFDRFGTSLSGLSILSRLRIVQDHPVGVEGWCRGRTLWICASEEPFHVLGGDIPGRRICGRRIWQTASRLRFPDSRHSMRKRAREGHLIR